MPAVAASNWLVDAVTQNALPRWKATMHTSNTTPAVRAHAPGPADGIPPDIWGHIVTRHICLREERTITSLACVSRLFARCMKPHIKPARLYCELQNASGDTQAVALQACMGTLYDLPEVDPSHRLELFLCVSTTLRRHFPGMTMERHIDALLASMEHLPQADQAKALIGLMDGPGDHPLCATKPRYVTMAARVGAMPPSAEQARLVRILGHHITGVNGEDFAARAQAFLNMCIRMQPLDRAQALSHYLDLVRRSRQAAFYSSQMHQIDWKQLEHNKALLIWGLHDCLQSIPLDALTQEERTVLLGRAVSMPGLIPDANEADRMAISLLRMVQPGNGDFCWRRMESLQGSLDYCMESMLKEVFEHGSRQSVHRFQRLYGAMAHLSQAWQIFWMRSFLVRCATRDEAGVTPALIVATAQAALGLPNTDSNTLSPLFALCLAPDPLRTDYLTESVHPPRVAYSARPDYTNRFNAKCGELVRVLRGCE